MNETTMNSDYSSNIAFCSKELSKIEKIAIKDTGDCEAIDKTLESAPDGAFVIDVDYYANIAIHNEKAKGDTDYNVYVIVDRNGTKYCTSSNSFWNSFVDIANEMEGEPFSIKVYRKSSKNYAGKYFLSCSIVA